MMPLDIPTLQFGADGTPVSDVYGDVYHSKDGGPEQARHVFLAGNELPMRWQGKSSFCVLETGFGLGLNFLATWQAWRADTQACRELRFVSLEKHPFSAADLSVAQAVWPAYAEMAATLRGHWPPLVPGEHVIRLDEGRVVLELIFGDAMATLPVLEAKVDAFFLDGFSPARNPELWSPEVCCHLVRLANSGATLATWSVAGSVRRALQDAGFSVEKRPGFAGKRQMLAGRLG